MSLKDLSHAAYRGGSDRGQDDGDDHDNDEGLGRPSKGSLLNPTSGSIKADLMEKVMSCSYG